MGPDVPAVQRKPGSVEIDMGGAGYKTVVRQALLSGQMVVGAEVSVASIHVYPIALGARVALHLGWDTFGEPLPRLELCLASDVRITGWEEGARVFASALLPITGDANAFGNEEVLLTSPGPVPQARITAPGLRCLEVAAE